MNSETTTKLITTMQPWQLLQASVTPCGAAAGAAAQANAASCTKCCPLCEPCDLCCVAPHQPPTRTRTCIGPRLFCVLLGLLPECADLHRQQLHSVCMAPLLPHGPHRTHTLLRVEQRCILLDTILLAGLCVGEILTQQYSRGSSGNSGSGIAACQCSRGMRSHSYPLPCSSSCGVLGRDCGPTEASAATYC